MDPIIGTFIAVVVGLAATVIFSWPIARIKNNKQELDSFILNLEHLKPTLSLITMIVLFFFAFHLADQALEKDHGGVPFLGWNFENTIIYGLCQAPSYGINEKVDILFCLDPASIILFCIFIGLLVVILKPPEGPIQRKKALSRAKKYLFGSLGVGILSAVLLGGLLFYNYSTPGISNIPKENTVAAQSSLYNILIWLEFNILAPISPYNLYIGLVFIIIAAIILYKLHKQLTSEIKHEYTGCPKTP